MFKQNIEALYSKYQNSEYKKLWTGLSVLVLALFIIPVTVNVLAADPPTATSTPPIAPKGYVIAPGLAGTELDPQTMAGFSLDVSVNSCEANTVVKGDLNDITSFFKSHINTSIYTYYTDGCATSNPSVTTCSKQVKIINNLLISYSMYKLENLKVNFTRSQECEPEDGQEYVVAPWNEIDFASMAYESVKETVTSLDISNSSELFSNLNSKLTQKFNASKNTFTYNVLSDRSQLAGYSTDFLLSIASSTDTFKQKRETVSTPETSAYLTSFYFFGIDDTSENSIIVPLIFDKISRFNTLFKNSSVRFASVWGSQNLSLRNETVRVLNEIISLDLSKQIPPQATSTPATTTPAMMDGGVAAKINGFLASAKDRLVAGVMLAEFGGGNSVILDPPAKRTGTGGGRNEPVELPDTATASTTATSTRFLFDSDPYEDRDILDYINPYEPGFKNGYEGNDEEQSCIDTGGQYIGMQGFKLNIKRPLLDKIFLFSIIPGFHEYYHRDQLGGDSQVVYDTFIKPGKERVLSKDEEKVLFLLDLYNPDPDGLYILPFITDVENKGDVSQLYMPTNKKQYKPCRAHFKVNLSQLQAFRLTFLHETYHIKVVTYDNQMAQREVNNKDWLGGGGGPFDQALIRLAVGLDLYEKARIDAVKKALIDKAFEESKK